VPRRNLQVRAGRSAFLKKSSKKLLIVLASACPDRPKPIDVPPTWAVSKTLPIQARYTGKRRSQIKQKSIAGFSKTAFVPPS
jgi:hypothetical protein